MLKLTEEQHAALLDLIEGDEYKVLLSCVLPQLHQQYIDKLVSADMHKAQDLVIERARLDGAVKIMNDLKTLKALIKSAKNK